jgi:capsule polysaccharide export protein KpsE/RkpR
MKFHGQLTGRIISSSTLLAFEGSERRSPKQQSRRQTSSPKQDVHYATDNPNSSIRKILVPTAEYESATLTTNATQGSMVTLLRMAMKWKRLVWITAAAIIVLSCLVALLLPQRYTATVVLLPPSQSGSTGAAMMAQMSNLGAIASAAGGMSMKNPNDQQVALLKSRTVEDAMIERFHLLQLYHRNYQSTTRKRWEDGLIRLSVTDRDSGRAADLANGWVEEYQRFTATLAITEASQRRLFYERQLSAAHENLVRAEEEMKQTEQRTGVIEIEGQARAMIASAAVLRGQLAAKQVEIRAMREFAADQNPDLVRAEQELAGMEGQLAAMDAASDRSTGDLIAPKGTVTQAGLDYTRGLREVKYRETIQDLLTRQYEGARVDEARQGALIQIVDPAVAPDRPSPYKLWIMLAALLAALPLALFTAWAAEVLAILRSTRRRAGSWPTALEQLAAGVWQ